MGKDNIVLRQYKGWWRGVPIAFQLGLIINCFLHDLAGVHVWAYVEVALPMKLHHLETTWDITLSVSNVAQTCWNTYMYMSITSKTSVWHYIVFSDYWHLIRNITSIEISTGGYFVSTPIYTFHKFTFSTIFNHPISTFHMFTPKWP